jgi:hypothetical protein
MAWRLQISSIPPSPPEGMSSDLIGEVMELAKVEDADPPRFSQIDPISLKSLLERKSGMKLTVEEVDPRASGSEAFWLLGNRPAAVEVTLFSGNSHSDALQAMKDALDRFSAPLNLIFISRMHIGQYTLQAVGGRGNILFVRNNVFVQLVGLSSSKELGVVAEDVDGFLKERGKDADRIAHPRITHKQLPRHRVKIGESFEVAVAVAEVGWMTASTDAAVVQLLEVDPGRAVFKFYAGSEGTCDIRLSFAHEATLQTAVASVHVEVVEGPGHE